LKDEQVEIESSAGFQKRELQVETEQETRPSETAEQLAAAMRVKEEETARRLSEEEAALLAEVEVLAREETELLTRLLVKQRSSEVILKSANAGAVVRADPLEAESDFNVESSQAAIFVPDEAPENPPFFPSPVSLIEGDSGSGLISEMVAIDPEIAEPSEKDEEFSPGEYILCLQHFPPGKVMALHHALRGTSGLKILRASGTTAGIEVSARLDKSLPLVAILSAMPGVGSVGRDGRVLLVSGRPVQ
jgi:hypothetical protein